MNKSSFSTLIELTRQTRNAAARLLASQHSSLQLAEQQLATLQQYRNEYDQQLQHAMDQGLDLTRVHNYQSFLASLDKAIARARHNLQQQQQQVSSCRQQWQEEQRRLGSYDTLHHRRLQQAKMQSGRRELREQDETATHLASRHKPDSLTSIR